MKTMLAEPEADDDRLVRLARAGDRSAFAALVERHYDFIYRVAWRWSASRPEAEDVAQEVCIRLAGAIGGFRGEGRFTTWLYALTLNAARDQQRKAGREARKAALYAVEPDSGSEAIEEEERAKALWAAVRRLPDKQREAVLLVYGEGLGHQAASEVMGCAEATVSWHIHEAKKRLRVLTRAAGEG
jgi:RNA polymerase sigma-70 factor, ECF subfamily